MALNACVHTIHLGSKNLFRTILKPKTIVTCPFPTSKIFTFFQTVFNDWFITLYPIVYTSIPILVLAMFDQVCTIHDLGQYDTNKVFRIRLRFSQHPGRLRPNVFIGKVPYDRSVDLYKKVVSTFNLTASEQNTRSLFKPYRRSLFKP